MIDFIIRNFFKGDVNQEAELEIKVNIPEKSRQEIFDEAVELQTKILLREDLKVSLFKLVYGEDVYEDTLKLSKSGSYPSWSRIKELFPKARYESHNYGNAYRASFKIEPNVLIDYLVDKALEEPKKQEDNK